MATIGQLLGIDDFLMLPDPEDGSRFELHEGELVRVGEPTQEHYALQMRLVEILKDAAFAAGLFIGIELPYRPTPKSYRRADVACIRRQRYESAPPRGNIEGSPELVIEVISPSNRSSDLERLQRQCLETGTVEFWTVHPETKTVYIFSESGPRRFTRDDRITSAVLPSFSSPVAELFR